MLGHRLRRCLNIKPAFNILFLVYKIDTFNENIWLLTQQAKGYIIKGCMAINYWSLRAISRHWRQIHLFTGVLIIWTCEIFITFLYDGIVYFKVNLQNPCKLRT